MEWSPLSSWLPALFVSLPQTRRQETWQPFSLPVILTKQRSRQMQEGRGEAKAARILATFGVATTDLPVPSVLQVPMLASKREAGSRQLTKDSRKQGSPQPPGLYLKQQVREKTLPCLNPFIFKRENWKLDSVLYQPQKNLSDFRDKQEEWIRKKVKEARRKITFTLVDFCRFPKGKNYILGAVTHAQADRFNWQDNRQTWDHGLLPLLINVPNAPSTNCQNKSSFALTFVGGDNS